MAGDGLWACIGPPRVGSETLRSVSRRFAQPAVDVTFPLNGYWTTQNSVTGVARSAWERQEVSPG